MTIASALMQSSGVIELQNVEIIVMKRVVVSFAMCCLKYMHSIFHHQMFCS